MNPSTAELLAAVESVSAGNVVLLPNNKNIIGVAHQVDGQSARDVKVVETRSVVSGIASMLAFSPEMSAGANSEAMARASAAVVACEITQAVRDSSSTLGEIRAGDWLGISPGGISAIAPSALAAATALLDSVITEDHELLTIITGAGAPAATTAAIEAHLSEHHSHVDVEVSEGGQPLYPYYFGLE